MVPHSSSAPSLRNVRLITIALPVSEVHNLQMMLTSANSGSIAAPTPPTIATPQLQAPPTPLQAPPTDSMDCSTSPTNTSGSDVSALSSSDLAAILAVSQQAAIKQEFMHQQVKQELPPMANPIFTMPDAAASLLQFIQAQQAVAQVTLTHISAFCCFKIISGVFSSMLKLHNIVSFFNSNNNIILRKSEKGLALQSKVIPQTIYFTFVLFQSYPCTFQFCVICQKDVHSSKLPCHIRQCHVAKPMFQCPACDFTSTYSKNNVKSHMVSLHGLAGDPISYMDKYAAQVDEYMKMCFPNVRGRGRPMQGRTSPRSPASPQQLAGRRNSQNGIPRRPSVHQQEMIALAAQQQQHALLAAAQG
uniref:C2H2-type domain-containing protein n=1 Tax=Heterorhabditis bacteriophora TaxID=37862 RepID=A0A1I7WYW2_HETBA